MQILNQLVPVLLSWGRITEDDSGLPMDGMAVLAVLCVLSPENYTTFFCCLPVVFLLPGGFSCGEKMKIIVACNVFSLGGIKSAIRLPLKKKTAPMKDHLPNVS